MKYIATYFTSFVILLFSIATFNWFIDPFGMYWSPQFKNINLVKPESGSRSRITKAYQVDKKNPQILIVGNSRVEMGIDPHNKDFSSKRVYNQGMPGSTVAMQMDYAIDTISNSNAVEHLLVGVDFLDFLIKKEQTTAPLNMPLNQKNSSYIFRLKSKDNQSKNAQFLRLKEKISLIFSLDSFFASISTIFQQKSMVNSISPDGLNSALSYVNIINTEGIKPLFQQKLTEIQTRLSKNSWKVKAQDHFPYSSVFFQLGRLIDAANNKNVQITFFINPYHLSYLHTIADTHQWQTFAQWKHTLVAYLTEKQGIKYRLWDFSGFSYYIKETVPFSTPNKQMLWYWEPAHYRKELGDLIISTLLKQNDLEENTNLFGVKLTHKNINSQLDSDNNGLKNTMLQWQKIKAHLE